MSSQKSPGGFCGIIAGGIGFLWLLGTVCSIAKHRDTPTPVVAPVSSQSSQSQADAIYAKIKADAEHEALVKSKTDSALKTNQPKDTQTEDLPGYTPPVKTQQQEDIEARKYNPRFKLSDEDDVPLVRPQNQNPDYSDGSNRGDYIPGEASTNGNGYRRGDDGAPKDQHVSGYMRNGKWVEGYDRRSRR